MATANATCYFPNGQNDPLSQSCNPNSGVSHCCQNTHVCLSNGLCWDTVHNHVIRGKFCDILSRVSVLILSTVTCTDASWTDPNCPQYCKDDTTTFYGDMRQCDGSDSEWVSGLDPSDCTNAFSLPVGYIDENRDVSLTAVIALPSVYSAATATGSATVATERAMVTTTVTATASARGSAMNNNATAIGFGAGLGVGLPLLAALLVSLILLIGHTSG
jgi:hypothetical protein